MSSDKKGFILRFSDQLQFVYAVILAKEENRSLNSYILELINAEIKRNRKLIDKIKKTNK